MILDIYWIYFKKRNMKRIALIFSFILVYTFSFGQDDLDRTGFTGQIISQLIIEANEAAETEKEISAETVIEFASKSITINDEKYEILSQEFDGIDLNTFLCTLRGSNFPLTYIVDEFIAISDNSKPDQVTYYMELTE
jgi:hypothetical protein